jgi:hypothetical protein
VQEWWAARQSVRPGAILAGHLILQGANPDSMDSVRAPCLTRPSCAHVSRWAFLCARLSKHYETFTGVFTDY